MRVTDGRNHQLVELPGTTRRLLRLYVHLPCTSGTVGATDMRTLLVADVLLRAVEADGHQVVNDLVHPELLPEQSKALDRVMSSLAVHPPAGLTGGADVHVFGDARRDGEQGVWIEVGRVQPDSSPELVELGEAEDFDPLAVRLALLSHPYRRPVPLTPDDIADAERDLVRWRSCVAEWARTPSRPVPDTFRRRAENALAEDLDTSDVLHVLRRVEASQETPAGAKFETFALLDRFLSLDLAREVGRA
ncbi:hypothetical protein ABZU94_08750 [Streptomyces mirabilis]|uniref:hypothetical protein n=1 Tax=Streptomyces sp. NPDC005388 TaxID=3156717 RepID=UPI0033B8D677